MASLSQNYHCVAPDLLGMGDSHVVGSEDEKFFEFEYQRTLLEAFIDHVFDDKKIILVVQGSGSVYGREWAYRNQHRVKGIVHIAGIFTDTDKAVEGSDNIIEFNEHGVAMLEDRPEAVEEFISYGLGCELSDWEFWEYCRPFYEAQAMAATRYSLVRLPSRDGAFSQIVSYTNWLANSDIPKLMFAPLNIFPSLALYRDKALSFKCQRVVESESHLYIQEEKPDFFIDKFSQWIQEDILGS